MKVPFWWHSFELPKGERISGQTSLEVQKLRAETIPKNIKNKTVLDVGCWDGYFSFYCENLGAKVTPIDNFQYIDFVTSKYGITLSGGEGFQYVSNSLDSSLEISKKAFNEIQKEFDVVLYFGILYHQKSPLLELQHLYQITKETVIIESHFLKHEKEPILKFYGLDILNNDPTNYWGPSESCIIQMLHSVGFKNVRVAKRYWDNDERIIIVANK